MKNLRLAVSQPRMKQGLLGSLGVVCWAWSCFVGAVGLGEPRDVVVFDPTLQAVQFSLEGVDPSSGAGLSARLGSVFEYRERGLESPALIRQASARIVRAGSGSHVLEVTWPRPAEAREFPLLVVMRTEGSVDARVFTLRALPVAPVLADAAAAAPTAEHLLAMLPVTAVRPSTVAPPVPAEFVALPRAERQSVAPNASIEVSQPTPVMALLGPPTSALPGTSERASAAMPMRSGQAAAPPLPINLAPSETQPAAAPQAAALSSMGFSLPSPVARAQTVPPMAVDVRLDPMRQELVAPLESEVAVARMQGAQPGDGRGLEVSELGRAEFPLHSEPRALVNVPGREPYVAEKVELADSVATHFARPESDSALAAVPEPKKNRPRSVPRRDGLRLSGAVGGGEPIAQGGVAAVQVRAALAELESRLTDLESIVALMKQLSDLQERQLGRLRMQLDEARPVSPTPHPEATLAVVSGGPDATAIETDWRLLMALGLALVAGSGYVLYRYRRGRMLVHQNA